MVDANKPISPLPPPLTPAKSEKKVEKLVVADEKAELKKKVLDEIGEVLKEYNGQESNIPINSNYWNLINQFRGL